MKAKNVLCMLLTVLLLSTAGCSSTSGDETAPAEDTAVQKTESQPETEDPNTVDDLPQELSFGGADFRILAGDEYGLLSFAEELTGEVLNDTKYSMELDVEERLDVEIAETPTAYWTMSNDVTNLIISGDSTYDSISMIDRFSLECAMKNAFLPMSEIEYVDLTKAYWGENLSDTLSIGGQYYFAVSSFNLRSYEKAACVLFNNAVAANHNIEIPFEAVFDGTWTFDMLESYGNIATTDVDGNGVMDRNDAYTYGTSDARHIATQCLISTGVKLADKDENGIPLVVIYDNEKFYSVMERIRAVFFMENCAATEAEFATQELFMDDRELLSFISMYSLTPFREMESDFSIVPTPKYDENQKDYISRTYDATFSMVPVTAADTKKSGAVMEALSSYGYKYLVPAYVETTLQEKYARDSESVKCVQIIFDTRTVDLGEAFLYSYLSNGIFQKLLTAGDGVASHLQSIRGQMDDHLASITTALLEAAAD